MTRTVFKLISINIIDEKILYSRTKIEQLSNLVSIHAIKIRYQNLWNTLGTE